MLFVHLFVGDIWFYFVDDDDDDDDDSIVWLKSMIHAILEVLLVFSEFVQFESMLATEAMIALCVVTMVV